MSSFDLFLDFLLQNYNYSLQCINLPLATANCSLFWAVSFSIAAFVMFLIFVSLIRYILRERREWKVFQHKQINRAKVADAETMSKVQWKRDDSFDDINESQLAEKMRQELKR
jgi:predicted membrane protein